MIHVSTLLRHYKRSDIQEEMLFNSKLREVAVRFADKGFGKRPDVLTYPKDVLELAKQGATSFHITEEHWSNPLNLSTELSRMQMDDLRTGWDLILDIDCKSWEHSKIVTDLLIKGLQKHGIKSISCKFSGNKGFHIGVPFEAFPDTVQGNPTKLMFPEGTKRIVEYLMDYIDRPGLDITKKILDSGSIAELIKSTGKDEDELIGTCCTKCETRHTVKKQVWQYVCTSCDIIKTSNKDLQFMECPKCGKLMIKQSITPEDKCKKCGATSFAKRFNTKAVLDVDTILISSRHMYRMPYSLHEKSGLCSVPIPIDSIISFDKKNAIPETVKTTLRFLDTKNTKQNEAEQLIVEAYDFVPKIEKQKEERKHFTADDLPEQAIPEEFFPPCVNHIFKGVEDGRKRSVFVLLNFLRSCGWEYDQIEDRLNKWNKKNREPLREVYIKGHIRYHKQQKKKMMPPNCDNRMYYKDLRMCLPDNLCKSIKNPVQYAKRKAKFYLEKGKKKKSAKKTTKSKSQS